ncbi:MAG TPA: hypothetical protein VE978_14110, partial [Chitinophagales bacterium]|nr:hypothetical protein [Chitinophagales bacterium]
MKSLSAIIIFTIFSATVFAQAGELDSTFGGDGIVPISIGINDVAFSIAIQSDGKIVVAGASANGPYDGDFALARFNSDGTPDSSFSNDGVVITADSSYSEAVYSVAVQPDGKIIEAGVSYNGSRDDFALVRFNTDGTLDTGFGTDGKVLTEIDSDGSFASAVAVQSDGKIVVAGTSSDDGIFGGHFVLARYNIDGSLDSSLSTDGIVITAFNLNDGATSVAIQSDGKIIEAGSSNDGTTSYFALVRYNADATLDNSFGVDGKVITSIGLYGSWINALAVQSDQKIVAAGVSWSNTYEDFTLVRYNTDGTLDNSFGTDGKVTTDNGSYQDGANSVVIQPDGKIVAAGNTSFQNGFVLNRYNINGSLDYGFGNYGKTNPVGGYSEPNSIAIQPDGKIVAAGNATFEGVALVRYLSGLNIGILNFSSSQSSPLIYPNPIQQTETLEYTLTKNESLTIALYDVNGKLV